VQSRPHRAGSRPATQRHGVPEARSPPLQSPPTLPSLRVSFPSSCPANTHPRIGSVNFTPLETDRAAPRGAGTVGLPENFASWRDSAAWSGPPGPKPHLLVTIRRYRKVTLLGDLPVRRERTSTPDWLARDATAGPLRQNPPLRCGSPERQTPNGESKTFQPGQPGVPYRRCRLPGLCSACHLLRRLFPTHRRLAVAGAQL